MKLQLCGLKNTYVKKLFDDARQGDVVNAHDIKQSCDYSKGLHVIQTFVEIVVTFMM